MSTRQARRRQQRVSSQRKGKPQTTPWYLGVRGLVAAVVVVVAVVAILVVTGQKNKPKSAYFPPATPSTQLLAQVTAHPTAVITKVGAGSTAASSNANPWTKISGPFLTSNGKPELLYLGAEYCPYCAGERWSMVNALSRFGTFTGLKLMKSSSTDVLPSTNTFTMRSVKYTSPYLSFVPVEETNNIQQTLKTPTAQQQALASKYDTGGGIPFLDLANRATASIGYDVHVLRSDPTNGSSTPLTWDQIGANLSNANSLSTQGIVGDANWTTAGICKITNNQPASACLVAPIPKLEKSLTFSK